MHVILKKAAKWTRVCRMKCHIFLAWNCVRLYVESTLKLEKGNNIGRLMAEDNGRSRMFECSRKLSGFVVLFPIYFILLDKKIIFLPFLDTHTRTLTPISNRVGFQTLIQNPNPTCHSVNISTRSLFFFGTSDGRILV